VSIPIEEKMPAQETTPKKVVWLCVQQTEAYLNGYIEKSLLGDNINFIPVDRGLG
jgi:hypothetical protein